MHKILIVDDDTFILDMYVVKFKEAGHEVDTARNAGEAIEKLRAENDFDVVLLDMIMPGGSGMDLLYTVKKEKLGNPVCIVLSNQGEQADIDAAKAAGAAGYIVKAEYIPSKVVEKVTSLVEESKSKK